MVAGAAIATVAVLLVVDGSRPAAAPAPPDAAVVAAQAARPTPDAAPTAPPIDAAPAAPPDAAPAPPKEKPKPKPKPKVDPLAGLSAAELKQVFNERYAEVKAASERKDFRTASRLAESIVKIARARGDYDLSAWFRQAAIYACLDGDAKRARAMFAKIIDTGPTTNALQNKQLAIDMCAREEIDLTK
jgi:hypothetical protein